MTPRGECPQVIPDRLLNLEEARRRVLLHGHDGRFDRRTSWFDARHLRDQPRPG
jgi:hypothetical protein